MTEPFKTVAENMLEDLSTTHFGRSRKESISQDICVHCGEKATEFTDETSRREFAISGFCQKCQDEVFKEDE